MSNHPAADPIHARPDAPGYRLPLAVACATAMLGCGVAAWAGIGLYRQFESGSWPQAPAIIREVSTAPAPWVSSGTRYEYIVDDEHRHGHRVRFSAQWPLEHTGAGLAVDDHVWVRYNPADPSVAVVSPGLAPSDGLVALACVPGLAWPAAWAWSLVGRMRARSDPAGGIRVSSIGAVVSARFERSRVAVWTLGGVGTGAVASLVIAAAGSFSISLEPAHAVGAALATAAGALVGGGLALARRLARDADIVIDTDRRVAHLARVRPTGGVGALDVRLDDIEQVVVDEHLNDAGGLAVLRGAERWTVTLVVRGAQGITHRYPVASGDDPVIAHRLADWLDAVFRPADGDGALCSADPDRGWGDAPGIELGTGHERESPSLEPARAA